MPREKAQLPEPVLIAETDAYAVLDKPAGWLTIPGRGESEAPVIKTWCEARWGQAYVVHRLDRETSGLLVVAKNAAAHRQLSMAFEAHEVRKEYDFIAELRPGCRALKEPVFKETAPLDGKAATTQIEVVERYSGAFLGRARPTTGRWHQVRLHLEGAGSPLLGDREHGGDPSLATRVALHARKLTLPKGMGSYEAPWPPDFTDWVTRLRSQK